MQWLQLIAGIGLGTLGAKLLDIFWLQRRVEEEQHRTWLRDKRLEAFAEVTKELVSFGLHEGANRTALQSYGAVSKALLLLDDDTLVQRIDHFIVEMERMNRLTDSPNSEDNLEGGELYESLVGEAREITRLLRNVILHGRVRAYGLLRAEP
jgi:hypothetical protein